MAPVELQRQGRTERQPDHGGIPNSEPSDEPGEAIGVVRPGAPHATTVNASAMTGTWSAQLRLSLRKPCRRTTGGPSPVRSNAAEATDVDVIHGVPRASELDQSGRGPHHRGVLRTAHRT